MRLLHSTVISALALLSLAANASPSQELPETCYVFTFFYHHAADEGLHLAWSRDGFSWETLNGDKPYLRPAVGESKIMRDPCLYQGPDGIYRLVWTTSWKGQTIGYACSSDLIHWSAQKAIAVMADEPRTQNCWAPEVIWDDAKRHYLVFWSSTVLGRFRDTENSNKGPEGNHRIYATTTKDFESFTPTRLLYDGGFNVIDATLAKEGDHWLMFVKNETARPAVEKNIRMIRAQTPEGPFTEASPALTGDYWAEGPSALKVGDEWRVYFDKHRENKYGVVVSRDLVHWRDLSDQTSFPKNARHGTVIAVPRAIIENLLQNQSPEANSGSRGGGA